VDTRLRPLCRRLASSPGVSIGQRAGMLWASPWSRLARITPRAVAPMIRANVLCVRCLAASHRIPFPTNGLPCTGKGICHRAKPPYRL
jgi:hypothetical protein